MSKRVEREMENEMSESEMKPLDFLLSLSLVANFFFLWFIQYLGGVAWNTGWGESIVKYWMQNQMIHSGEMLEKARYSLTKGETGGMKMIEIKW